jgi:hypothetical protein
MGEPAYGLWPGTVVSDEDPDKEGKLRVRVDQFYGAADESEKIEDTDLPWARPGQFLAGAGSGTPRTPEVGAGVWVGFWGGSRSKPVWFGGFYGAGEVPSEFTSAYTPGPKTWLTKTPHDHAIEMRWVESEEEIRIETADGIKIRLQDADALEGPRILLETPGGFQIVVDEKTQKIEALTPAGRTLLIDDQNQLAKLATIAQVVEMLDASGAMNLTATGTMTLTATQLTLAVATISVAILSLTATGLLTLTGAGVSIVTTAAAVTIGSVAAATSVVLSTFLLTKYDNHTHLYAPGGLPPAQTGGPSLPHAGAPADVSQNVVVD